MMTPPLSADLSTRIAGILDFLQNSMQSAGKFAADQAPDVVREVLAWNFWSTLGLSAACLLGAVISSYAVYRIVRWEIRNDGFPPITVFLAAVPLGLLAAALVNCAIWLKILIAPKLFLIEYAASLLQK